jgi:GH15 family glucan-1,4-alpha-glucosidase
MALPIEDYALIGNLRTAALVGRDGSIDWLCVPRFDDPACFCALLGTAEHGRWLLAPARSARKTTRRYRNQSLILETEFETATGSVRVVDFMPMWGDRTDVVRIVEGLRGKVAMRMELVLRFGYGSVIPWVRRVDGALLATGGPHSAELRAGVDTHGEDFRTVAEFTVAAGQRVPFIITLFPSYQPRPLPIDPGAALGTTEQWWDAWSGRCKYDGPWRDAVLRSFITLKSLAHAPTGGIVAAPTTSLPERIGGARNWDYRFCWVRDSTFTLYALLLAGYRDEAAAWREWLLRSAAGRPDDLQTLYGVDGDRVRTEFEIPWLPGYEHSAPVRVGNGASVQFQLDVYGELIDTMCVARAADLVPHDDAWRFEVAILRFLEKNWNQPDHGIWETRGDKRHFTHSKVMAWVAFDRAISDIEKYGLRGPVARWRKLRARIHADICRNGFDRARNTFVQHYDATEVDASLLLIPQVGFLPPEDPRVRGTIAAIERELVVDGLVMRYRTLPGADAKPPGEGRFLPCSFWLADALALCGRHAEAKQLFVRLLKLCNDVGLLAEEYDPGQQRMLGNFPQALSHVALINTARNLSRPGGPAEDRSRGSGSQPHQRARRR